MENKLIAKGTTTDLNLILKLTLLKLMEVREVMPKIIQKHKRMKNVLTMLRLSKMFHLPKQKHLKKLLKKKQKLDTQF
jgi:hypothetical protein